MTRSRLVILSIAAFATLLPFTGSAAEKPKPSGEELVKQLQLLFVQSAGSGSFDGARLTLAVAGPTLFFSDRPARLSGHLSTAKFLGNWKGGADSFEVNPPNASLSIMEGDETVNAVVVLTDPKQEGGTLSYAVKVLEGKIPAKFGTASLFIDGGAGGYIAAALGGGLLGGALTHANDNANYARQQSQYYGPPPQPYYGNGYYYRSQPGPPPCE
jgi:hypothetical protein